MYKKLINTSSKVWNRHVKIYPKLVGLDLEVHNGLRFIKLKVNKKMVGHKLGEFAKTRVTPKHPSKNKK
jgi:ribosomal protein S19